MRPIFRERAEINAEVTGRLTESLGGVRVVKGYHAEGEARVLRWRRPALQQRHLQLHHRAVAHDAYRPCWSWAWSAASPSFLGAHEIAAHRLDVGGRRSPMLLGFMVAPIVQLVSIGTQLTEALAGLDRTTEVAQRTRREPSSDKVASASASIGDVAFHDVTFEPTSPTSPFSMTPYFPNRSPAPSRALVGSSGSGKSTIISLICGFHTATGGSRRS